MPISNKVKRRRDEKEENRKKTREDSERLYESIVPREGDPENEDDLSSLLYVRFCQIAPKVQFSPPVEFSDYKSRHSLPIIVPPAEDGKVVVKSSAGCGYEFEHTFIPTDDFEIIFEIIKQALMGRLLYHKLWGKIKTGDIDVIVKMLSPYWTFGEELEGAVVDYVKDLDSVLDQWR